MILLKMGGTSEVEFYSAETESLMTLPFVSGGIAAGFPSPADDYLDTGMDLNHELVKNPATTFYGRVKGLSMKDDGILPNDILIVDKSLEPKNGDLAVCFIDGEFTLKRIAKKRDCIYLMPANPEFKPIRVTEENDFIVWGIVTWVIKNTRR